MSRSPGNKSSTTSKKVNLTPGAGGVKEQDKVGKTSVPDLPPPSTPMPQRKCGVCDSPLRVFSAGGRVKAACGPCKRIFEIGYATALTPEPPMGRGLRKETRIEPDWDQALNNDDADDTMMPPGYEEETW